LEAPNCWKTGKWKLKYERAARKKAVIRIPTTRADSTATPTRVETSRENPTTADRITAVPEGITEDQDRHTQTGVPNPTTRQIPDLFAINRAVHYY
jgi:hypothetical protein